jgi:tetratricopeptide (TPR) repeat protein
MKRLVTAALVVLASFLASSAFAQTGMARGKVFDDKGQPLAGAKVLWEFQGGMTRKGEVTTNKKGEFVQVGLQPGMYRFTANAEGFQPQYAEVRVSLGDPTVVPEFQMTPKTAAEEKAADPGLSALKAGVDQAIALAQAGKTDEALAAYADLAAKNPNVHQIPFNMGLIYAGKKDWANAEASYKKSLELKPDYAEALTSLSTIYLNTGRAAEANELLAKSAGGSTDPKILLQQGVVLFNSGKSAEAAEVFQKLVAADPTSAEPYFYLGSIAVGQGKTAECITHLEKYLSLNPQNATNVVTAKGLIAALPRK